MINDYSSKNSLSSFHLMSTVYHVPAEYVDASQAEDKKVHLKNNLPDVPPMYLNCFNVIEDDLVMNKDNEADDMSLDIYDIASMKWVYYDPLASNKTKQKKNKKNAAKGPVVR
jgi:hypothetical protein